MNQHLERRLRRIEQDNVVDEPRVIISDRPLSDDDEIDLEMNWRSWIARGEATLSGGVLAVLSPVLTEEQWAAECCTSC